MLDDETGKLLIDEWGITNKTNLDWYIFAPRELSHTVSTLEVN